MATAHFDPDAPVIVLEVTLYGESGTKRRITAALDTGATYSMIPWEIAEALGYQPELSREKVSLVTASGVEAAPVINVSKVNFLGENIENVKVVCHDLPPKSYVVGLLGASFLRHFKTTIDSLLKPFSGMEGQRGYRHGKTRNAMDFSELERIRKICRQMDCCQQQ